MLVKRPHAKVATRVSFLDSDISSVITFGTDSRSVITSVDILMESVRMPERNSFLQWRPSMLVSQ